MKKPSVPKCFGGSQKIFLGCSTSSLAVFYVEQVALKSPRAPPLPATLFMRLTAKDVKAEKSSWRSVSDCATSPEVARFPDTMRHAHTERSA